MIRSVALLGLVASASALFGLFEDNKSWEGDLKVRFDATLLGIGKTAFIELPKTVASASEKGWKQITPPELHDGYASLSMFCPEEDYTVCCLFDDTDFVAGLQVALQTDKFSGNILDWTVQGFTSWTIEVDGTTVNFWATQQYFIAPETLATDPAIRVAQRNPNLLLQDDSILVSGFNRELYRISTNVTDITGPNSDFTKQACIPWMGQHYYYKTTVDSECKEDTLFPWFPLVYSEQLIGVGMVMFGKYDTSDGHTAYFEEPPKLAVRAIVPRGPQCLYDLADSPGLVTMHTYFIKKPYEINCIFS